MLICVCLEQVDLGKSFYTKLMILRYRLLGIEQYVIDPEREYEMLAKNVNGSVLKIGPTSNTYVNILDIRKELIEDEKDSETIKIFFETVEKLKEKGIEVVEEHFDKNLLNALHPVYHVISSAEATSNLANLTGIIFGSRVEGSNSTELMINSRTEGFSEFIKRRFILLIIILSFE